MRVCLRSVFQSRTIAGLHCLRANRAFFKGTKSRRQRPQSDPAKSEGQVGVLANLVFFWDHSQRVVLSPKARC